MDLNNHCNRIKKCRISEKSNLTEILSLGIQPLANSLKKNQSDVEDKFSLSISFCEESSLLQLNETIDKEVLFDHYVWVTGTSGTTRNYANDFYTRAVEMASPAKDEVILEIASNDGTFLKPFVTNGHKNTIGVDAAKNVAQTANDQGIRTLPEFFSSTIANQIIRRLGI